MLYETSALQQAYAVRTGLRQVLWAYCMTEFFFKQFCGFPNVVRVKKILKKKILSSPWWYFELATSPIFNKYQFLSIPRHRHIFFGGVGFNVIWEL